MTAEPQRDPSPLYEVLPARAHRAAAFSERRTALIAGGCAFMALAALALRPTPNPLDVAITTRLQRRTTPQLARLMKLISSPGYAPFTHSVVLSLAANLWVLERRRDAIFTVGTMGAGFTTGMLKMVVGRPRPDPEFRRHQKTFKDNSFPSGHATHYTAFYGYVFFLARRTLPEGPLRTGVMAYCLSLIALVSPSRIYLGHHWASDVAAGQLVGFTYLMCMLQMYESFDRP